MNQQQITQIALEIGQLAGAVLTVITAIPATQAPSWLPLATGVLTAVATVCKQIYGNTPQNVPGSTAQDIAKGVVPAMVPAAPGDPVVAPAAPVASTPVPTYPVIK